MSLVGIMRRFGAHARLHPAHVVARLEPVGPEPLRKLLQELVHRIGLLLEPLAQPPAGERDALRLDRLQQVVDRALVEGLDRILVVRGDEDDVRPVPPAPAPP